MSRGLRMRKSASPLVLHDHAGPRPRPPGCTKPCKHTHDRERGLANHRKTRCLGDSQLDTSHARGRPERPRRAPSEYKMRAPTRDVLHFLARTALGLEFWQLSCSRYAALPAKAEKYREFNTFRASPRRTILINTETEISVGSPDDPAWKPSAAP